MNNKKGQIGVALITFTILIFVLLLFFGTWNFFNAEILSTLIATPNSTTGAPNVSQVALDTFGQVNDAMIPGMRTVSFFLIIGMVIAMLLVEFFSRKHPAWFIFDFFIVILAFILAVMMSNRYEALLVGQPFSSSLLSLTQGTSIMLHLPRWVTVIGLLGMTLSLIGIIRRRGTEEFA